MLEVLKKFKSPLRQAQGEQIPNSKFQIILEYGFYLLVFLLPWQTKLILRPGVLHQGVWEYGTIALFGTDILLIGLLIIFAIQYFCHPERSASESQDDKNFVIPTEAPLARSGGIPFLSHQENIAERKGSLDRARDDKEKKRFFQERGIVIILSGLDLFVFLSIFFAPDLLLAVYRYVLFLLGFGLFWLAVKIKYDNTKLAIAFFSGLFIQSCLAIWQFLAQSTFSSKWLGMAAHPSGDLGTSVIETVGAGGIAERWLRAYGSLDHPNILGGLLAVGLIILIYFYLRGYFKNDANKKEKIKNKKFFLFSFLIFILALLFTFSRSAWLALAAGIMVFLFFYIFKKDRPALKRLGLVVILATVLFGMIFSNYQNLFITRVEGSARLETKSISERKTYLDDSLRLIKEKWIFGSGIGNYTKVLAEKDRSRPWYYLQPVHNAFLLVGAEIGIFGLLFFIVFLLYLLAQSARKKNVLGLSILLSLVIMMLFDHYFWSLHFGVLFFWILCGIIFKYNQNKYEET